MGQLSQTCQPDSLLVHRTQERHAPVPASTPQTCTISSVKSVFLLQQGCVSIVMGLLTFCVLQAAIAKQMEGLSPHGDRYICTTHSYLISLFLDCPLGMGLNCPNSTTTAAVLDAIKSGAITWHAHPHNAQYEFYDTSLLEFSFDLTHDLDRQFGFAPKHTAILVSLCCDWLEFRLAMLAMLH